ncbi:MAG: hypothetical protein K2L56_07530, partial [Prevotella sp.]|nr:hypothetical protein [Prevotella sp.]
SPATSPDSLPPGRTILKNHLPPAQNRGSTRLFPSNHTSPQKTQELTFVSYKRHIMKKKQYFFSRKK